VAAASLEVALEASTVVKVVVVDSVVVEEVVVVVVAEAVVVGKSLTSALCEPCLPGICTIKLNNPGLIEI